MRHVGFLLLLALGSSGLAHAETDRERAAREVDEQMKHLVTAPPPPHARVVWEGIDSDKVAIDEARFELDDARLAYGDVEELAAGKSRKTIYDGAIDAGKHTLSVTLAIHRTKVSLLEGLRTTTFKVSSGTAFPGQAGLEVTLRVKLHYDETVPDPKKRLKLETRMESKMVANVDDSPMPERERTVVAEAKPVEPKTVDAKPTAPEHAEVAATEPDEPHGKHGKHEKKPKPTREAVVKPARAQPALVAKAEPIAPVATAMAVAVDAGLAVVDAGPPDAGPVDAGPPDAGPMLALAGIDAGAPVSAAPAESSNSVVWIGVAAGAVVFFIVLAIGLRQRKRGF